MEAGTREELVRRLKVFIDHDDRSKAFVSELEGFFLEEHLHLEDDERLDQLGLALASYDPAGLEPGLLDEDAMARVFRGVLHDFNDHVHCSHLLP